MDAKLSLSRRDTFGKKARALKQDGKVLGNIFGKGEASIAVYGDGLTLEKTVNQAGKNHPIDVTLDDGTEILVLVNEVERDSTTRHMHHVTFQKIVKGEKVTTEVPLHLVGNSPAAKKGLIIVTMLHEIEVEADPTKLPDVIEISVESLDEDGDSLYVRDIVKIADVDFLTDADLLIAKVDTPRAQIEEVADEAESADAAAVPSDHGTPAQE